MLTQGTHRSRKKNRFLPQLEAFEDRSLLDAAAPGLLDPDTVAKFVNTLPQPLDPSFVYQPAGTTTVTLSNGKTATVPLYKVGAYQIQESLLGKDISGHAFPLTTVYGYGTSQANATYPGRSFEVQSGQPIAVQWADGLTSHTHLLPVDPTVLDPAGDTANGGNLYTVSTATVADTPVTGTTNAAFVTFPNGIPIVTHVHGGHTQAIFDGTPLEYYTPNGVATGADYPGTTTFTYDNSQQAGTIWYHDHAMGVTRLNVYAGLAGFYITHDKNEQNLINGHHLPDKPYDIPLAIQDRQFTAAGQLYYPSDVLDGTTATYPSEHPEFFGDTILVNGQAWPVLHVEPRMYRFRILNGSEARFYNLSLDNGQSFYQVGTDDGLLNAPVQLNQLLIAPGERADVVIDFSKVKKGTKIILKNNAPAPFPAGDKGNFYGGSVGQIMEFVVDVPMSKIKDVSTLKTDNPTPSLNPKKATVNRDMALFESTDEFGRLIQFLGTPQNGWVTFADSMDPADTVQLIKNKDGTQSVIEIWHVYNTTADTHPIHLHQVSFQILSRQGFAAEVDPDTGVMTNIVLNGQARGPDANEAGWKDTVRMNPQEVTTIIAKFDLPGKYVWHCHILEHEEHDMMHWLVVLPAGAAKPAATTPTPAATVLTAVASATNALASPLSLTASGTVPAVPVTTSSQTVLSAILTAVSPPLSIKKATTSLLDPLLTGLKPNTSVLDQLFAAFNPQPLPTPLV